MSHIKKCLACLNILFLVSSVAFRAHAQVASNTDVEQAIQLGKEASVALFGRKYDEAIVNLRQAISLNPNDAGAKYDARVFSKNEISDHGRSQVSKMLADRPLMSREWDESDDLLNWAAWKYSSKLNEKEILWDPAATDDPRCYSQAHISQAGEPSTIRVRDLATSPTMEKAAMFDWLWSCAVFELHNLDNAEEFDVLYEKARSNQIDEREFVAQMFALELRTAQRTRKWYMDIYIPYAKRHGLATFSGWWQCAKWGSAESRFAKCVDKNSYPWVPYSSFFERLSAGR